MTITRIYKRSDKRKCAHHPDTSCKLEVRDYDYMWKDGVIYCTTCNQKVGHYDSEFSGLSQYPIHKLTNQRTKGTKS
jgi:hypothetical protein